MNTKLSKKAAAWSLYQVLGLVMILSMVFAAPLVVMAWTVPEPPDQEPGGIVTIKVGDSYEGQYDKALPVEVTVTSGPVSSAYPDGYKPLCLGGQWGTDDIWTCEIQLDPDEAVSVGEYNYMVKQGDIVEYGTFTDAAPPKVNNFVQCDPPTPYDQSTYTCEGNWTGGQNDGIFYEGDAIPYRAHFSNLVVGDEYYFQIRWDTTKSGKHALDYLTSYNHTLLMVDPCLGYPCTGLPEYTYPIPPDTFMQSDPNWMGSQDPGDFAMWGAEITDVSDYETPLNYDGDTETSIMIYFTAEEEDAVLAWGGHISERADWGPNNSAVFIPGSPYHMRSGEFFDITNNRSRASGSTDLPLSATGTIYPAYVKIIKNAIPDSEQMFGFDGSFGQFSLKDNGTDPNFVSFSTVEFGTKTITETEPTGWDLTNINCVNLTILGTGTVTSVTPPSAVLNVQEADMWECTFTNEVLYGNIIVDKVTVPSGDSQQFTFTPSWGPTFQLADATAPYNSGPILAGTYSLVETVPAGWDLTNVTCLSNDGITTYLPTAINLSPMETVTCTFTNTKRGQIIVDKVTVPAGDTQLFTFNPSWSETDFQLADATPPHNSGYLVPGTYSVAETVPTGWDLTSAVCSDGSPITAIDLAAGETVTCTFTNTKRGQIIVDKVTVPAGDTQLFTFNPSWSETDFQLADATPPHNSGYLVPGTYSVAETVPTGWVLTSATCSDGSPVTAISLQAGETVTCTFTNSKLPKLTLVKTVVNTYGGTKVVADFPLFINTTPATSGMAYTLTPGSYTASETQQFGYTAPLGWQGDCATNGNVTLTYGDNKTCTITNKDIQPKLYVIKVVDNKGYGTKTPADFTMNVAGTNVSPTSFPGASVPGTLVTLNQGTYLVTETVDPMYNVSYSADCSSTIMVGQTKTCTVTNTFKIPGWTPGFWKNHGPGAPHGKDAWQYTAFMPGDLLDDVFELGMVAGLPVKGSSTGFIDKTLMEALGFRGGGGESGAAEILLRAAVASLLNASFAEEYDAIVPGLFFPMTVDEVIEAVNEALDSFDRYEMLTLAAELDMLNNGSWDFPWDLLP
jgi:hypothetical protein